MNNAVLDAIHKRRSIRKYRPEQITKEELETVLEAGTWAPTGMGRQSPWIGAVRDKAQRDLLSKINAEIMGTTSDPFYGAPTIVLVFAPTDNSNGERDGSLVLGTMMLAAQSINLSTCWINRIDKMSEREDVRKLMDSWHLPHGLRGVGSIALGYAAAPAKAPKPRKEGYYRIV